MATGKTYYWIKLRKDFLTGDVVDYLMANGGSDYVVLYLMLCAQTINTNGMLANKIGEVIIKYDIDKIKRECKYFSREIIYMGLKLFCQLGLIYTDTNGVLAISGYSSLVGKETDYAAQKKIQREKKKQAAIEDTHKDMCEDTSVDIVHTGVESVGKSEDTTVDIVHTEIEIRDRDRVRDRDKEIEIELEKEKEKETASKNAVSRTDVQRVIDAWNSIESIPAIKSISSSSKRYKSLVARIREHGVDAVLEAIGNIKDSDFLTGKATDFVITIDWFVKPNNFPKVLEGNYSSKRKNAAGDGQQAERSMDMFEKIARGLA